MIKPSQKEETKKGNELKEAFVLWLKTSKSGNQYLNGYVSDHKDMKLVAYFNTDKKNPKEPDVRVYESIKDKDGNYKKSEKEIASLWTNTSEKDTKYLSGYADKDKLVGFYGDEHKELRPYIRCYYDNK